MDFNIEFGDANEIPSRKLGFLHWEADTKIGKTIYSFEAWTKAGAVKKAIEFKESQ